MSIDPCNKPPLSFEEQAKILKKMGLGGSVGEIISRLQYVNYDRLAGYWYQFWKNEKAIHPTFKKNVDIDLIWQCYRFDRRIRLLAMDAVERIEVAIRTQVVNCHVLKYGPKGYKNENSFTYSERLFGNRKVRLNDLTIEWLNKTRYKEPVLEDYKNKCPKENYLPFWKLVQLLDFGWCKDIFLALDDDLSQKILKPFNLNKKKMKSWLESLRIVRNICAHHSRLFNRRKLFDIKLPHEKYQPEWYEPVAICTNENKGKLFPILTMMGFMLKVIIPKSEWMTRLKSLLKSHEFLIVPKVVMGFPNDWEKSPLWTDDEESKGAKHATV